MDSIERKRIGENNNRGDMFNQKQKIIKERWQSVKQTENKFDYYIDYSTSNIIIIKNETEIVHGKKYMEQLIPSIDESISYDKNLKNYDEIQKVNMYILYSYIQDLLSKSERNIKNCREVIDSISKIK